MSTKAEVKYANGEVEVFTITSPSSAISNGYIYLGKNLLVNADQVASVQIFEDVPEPEVETEETVEIPATDKYDSEETQLDRIERAIEEWGKKSQKPPIPTTSPWIYPNTTYPDPKPYIITNSSKNYAAGGVVPSEKEKVEATVGPDEKVTPLDNIYITVNAPATGLNIDDLVSEVSKQLSFSEELGDKLEKLAEPLSECMCPYYPNEICPDHPYGYYV